MKIIKKILLTLLILVVLFIAALVAIPYFFKDEIIEEVKIGMNRTLDADVAFGDVDISLIKSFPNLSLSIHDFDISGKGDFDGVKLAKGASMDMAFNFFSIFKTDEPFVLRGFHLEKPEINIVVTKAGKANYDIYKSEPAEDESATPSKFVVKLKKYTINDGHIVYDDRSADVKIDIKGLDHAGSGQFTADVYDLDTKSTADELTFVNGGMKYLSKVKTKLDVVLNMDMPKMKFSLKDNDLWLNELHVQGDGFVQLPKDDNMLIDFKFHSPQNRFKDFLSIVPGAYTKDFASVQSHGKLKLDGTVKGEYGTHTLPNFDLNLEIADGDVKYAGMPIPITDIQSIIHIKNRGNDLDNMIIHSPKNNIKVGNRNFAFNLDLKTPISDPDVKSTVKGSIDLADFAKAYPMDGVEKMAGIINADARINTKLSYLDKQQYEKVLMDGVMNLKNIVYKATNQPQIAIENLKIDFTPEKLILNSLRARLGRSDIAGDGVINNILAWFSPEKTMTGKFIFHAARFDANEWMTTDVNPETSVPAPEETAQTEVFDRFDFDVDGKIDALVYENYDIKNLKMRGQVAPQKMKIDHMSVDVGKSDFSGSGQINNMMDYVFKQKTLTGNLNLQSDLMDLNEIMAMQAGPESGKMTVSTTPATPFKVPGKMDVKVNTKIDKVIYTDMDLKNITGVVEIADEKIKIKNFKGRTLGGKISMMGIYDTKDKEKPEFDLKYDFANMDFRKTFNTFNTFEKIAPIGKYLEGNFSTNFIMDGSLDNNMFPDLNSISAEGFFNTIKGVIRGVKPLEKAGNLLGVSYFNDIKIEDTKNYFIIKDGAIVVKEFDLKHKGIDMKISGSHSFTNEMNYNIKAKIPRKMFGKAAAGLANKGLGLLQKEASKLGVNLDVGEFVNVLINFKGTMDNPKVSLKLLGTEGKSTLEDQVKETVKDAVDEQVAKAKAKAQEEADKAKAKAKEELDKAAAAAKAKAKAEIEKAKQKALEEAKDKIGKDVVDKVDKKIDEVLDDKTKKTVDDIKDKLDNWNPFKKKKKKGGG